MNDEIMLSLGRNILVEIVSISSYFVKSWWVKLSTHDLTLTSPFSCSGVTEANTPNLLAFRNATTLQLFEKLF